MSAATMPRRAPAPSGALFAWLAIVTLGVGIPALFLSAVEGEMTANVALMFGVVTWSIYRLVYAGLQGRRRLTLLCFYVFVYVFLGVQPLLSVWSGSFPYAQPMSQRLITITIGLIALGILAFEAAYSVARRSPRRLVESRDAEPVRRLGPVRLPVLRLCVAATVAMFLAVMARYGAAVYLGVRGGGFTLGASEGASEGAGMSQAQWLLLVHGLRALAASLLFVAVYLWTTRREYDWSRRATTRVGVTLGFLVLFNAIVSNPVNAPRMWSGALLVTGLFIAVRWKGARSFLMWSLMACLGFLTVFAGIDPRRIVGISLIRGEPITVGSTVAIMQESTRHVHSDGNFDAFQMIALSKEYADSEGHSLGRQMLLPMFFWIPRSLWPDKPIGTSDVVASWLAFASTNVGCPLWAEGYVNFGVLGIVLFLGAFGCGARLADDYLTRTAVTGGAALPTIASAFYAANTFILLRGDLTTGTMFLQMVIGLTFGILALIRRRAARRVVAIGDGLVAAPTGR